MRFCSHSDEKVKRAPFVRDALPSAPAPNFAVLSKSGAALSQRLLHRVVPEIRDRARTWLNNDVAGR